MTDAVVPTPGSSPTHRDRSRHAVTALALIVLVAACTATQPALNTPPSAETPRFLLGLWHGMIAPITFVVSLFSEHVRVYAYPNAGRWYDFGFMLGIGGFSGGIFAGSRKRRVVVRTSNS